MEINSSLHEILSLIFFHNKSRLKSITLTGDNLIDFQQILDYFQENRYFYINTLKNTSELTNFDILRQGLVIE